MHVTRISLGLALAASLALADDGPSFAPPQRLEAQNDVVKVEAPGYAFPCWADATGDGVPDLVVGQFNEGKMKVYPNLGEGKLGAGVWLQAEGKVAQVPGVW